MYMTTSTTTILNNMRPPTTAPMRGPVDLVRFARAPGWPDSDMVAFAAADIVEEEDMAVAGVAESWLERPIFPVGEGSPV